jgi:hypothetical protein
MSTNPNKKNQVRAGLRRRGNLLAAALRPPARAQSAGRSPAAAPAAGNAADIAPSKVPRLVESPVFLLCPQRSGSTLLRVLLNSHSEIRAPHELHLRHLRVKPGRDFTLDVMAELGLDVRELEYMLWDNVLRFELERSGKSQIVAQHRRSRAAALFQSRWHGPLLRPYARRGGEVAGRRGDLDELLHLVRGTQSMGQGDLPLLRPSS